jgi:hypothetical protein
MGNYCHYPIGLLAGKTTLRFLHLYHSCRRIASHVAIHSPSLKPQTSGIFLVYDCLVQRRQQIVMNEAVKSTKVVHSLFPEAVRERMQAVESHGSGDEEYQQQHVVADLYPEATVLFAGKLACLVAMLY